MLVPEASAENLSPLVTVPVADTTEGGDEREMGRRRVREGDEAPDFAQKVC